MAASVEDAPEPRLPELLESSRQLLEEVELATEPTGSKVIQDKVATGLEQLRRASAMLAQLDLFSRNEDWEEIASADLKYLLLPALQGAFTLKLVGSGRRLEHLRQAREHFVNFLWQAHNYRVADFELPWAQGGSLEDEGKATTTASLAEPSLIAMASQRQAKIQRYRQKKEAEQRLSALRAAVESGQAEDQQVREYHLLHLRRWVSISLDEMDSIAQEMKILRERDSSSEAPAAQPQEKPPMKPFVLTRGTAQARVFGAGYPSLATMTVNEWYEQHQKCEALPAQEVEKHPAADFHREARPREEPEEEEEEEEEEDEEALHRLQHWDDWKDTHPGGYGNRQNMG